MKRSNFSSSAIYFFKKGDKMIPKHEEGDPIEERDELFPFLDRYKDRFGIKIDQTTRLHYKTRPSTVFNADSEFERLFEEDLRWRAELRHPGISPYMEFLQQAPVYENSGLDDQYDATGIYRDGYIEVDPDRHNPSDNFGPRFDRSKNLILSTRTHEFEHMFQDKLFRDDSYGGSRETIPWYIKGEYNSESSGYPGLERLQSGDYEGYYTYPTPKKQFSEKQYDSLGNWNELVDDDYNNLSVYGNGFLTTKSREEFRPINAQLRREYLLEQYNKAKASNDRVLLYLDLMQRYTGASDKDERKRFKKELNSFLKANPGIEDVSPIDMEHDVFKSAADRGMLNLTEGDLNRYRNLIHSGYWKSLNADGTGVPIPDSNIERPRFTEDDVKGIKHAMIHVASNDRPKLDNRYAYAKSGIKIKKENRGKFTESAKRTGESVLKHARSVLNNPKATKLLKRRALFAVNSTKFNH